MPTVSSSSPATNYIHEDKIEPHAAELKGTNNAMIAIAKFRESVHKLLALIKEKDKSFRFFTQEDTINTAYNELAEQHTQQAWWHVVGIVGGVLEGLSGFFDKGGSVCAGIGKAAQQGTSIADKYGQGQIAQMQGELERLKKKVEELERDGNASDTEIRQLLDAADQFITKMARSIGAGVNPLG